MFAKNTNFSNPPRLSIHQGFPKSIARSPWRTRSFGLAVRLAIVVAVGSELSAQEPRPLEAKMEAPSSLMNALPTPAVRDSAGLATTINQFSADMQTMGRRFRVPQDETKRKLQLKLLQEWREQLSKLPFSQLDRAAQVDWILLRNDIDHRMASMAHDEERDRGARELIPYLDELVALELHRENAGSIAGEEIAESYQRISQKAKNAIKELGGRRGGDAAKGAEKTISPTVGIRAAQVIRSLKQNLEDCHRFYSGYDPSYSWWGEKPYQELSETLQQHAQVVSKVIAGIDESDKDKIVGLPIGEVALREELIFAMIPYTPNELVEIANREFLWCETESTRAANDMGFNGDWHKALEQVKSLHVDPGQQPNLIRELAWEAIRFLESNDLITVPPLAANGWRMEMMSPEAQRVNPYFLGGERIIVSFPTNTMSHAEKLMSLRSNNIHFSRATVHHELIPGHHLQHYMTARYHPHRKIFDTPFWVEGWALYWEMLLWDLDFPKSPEDRVGMLFWRKHRCARIIFSLNYHLGKWSPEECTQYLIDRVGHEPSAAAAEVRRSIMGNYGPLYQAAYMLGGLQIRGLRDELVQSGKMNNRQFHDAVIQQNSIPIEMVRASLTQIPLTPDYATQWRFADKKAN